MKLWFVLSSAALAVAISGCADKSNNVAAPNADAQTQLQQVATQQPNVSGTVWIRQRIALPPDAVLTVTLSDASRADAPSKVVSQWVVRTEGKQAPFHFSLPYNPADIQPGARTLLSAAIMHDGKMLFVTDSVQQVNVTGNQQQDLTLIPVSSIPSEPQSGETINNAG